MAGHKKIETNGTAMIVSSFKWKRAMGQIPSMQRNGISITLVPVDGGVEATVLATDGAAQADLLIGSSPAERAVNEVVGFLTPGGNATLDINASQKHKRLAGQGY
ncbi:MAG: hypothetical protein ACLP8S_13865 [Solirubrobacteraceae bacterium]